MKQTFSIEALNDPTLEFQQQHRQQFPTLTHKTYFNYGGQGPMPQAALEAIRQAHEFIQNAGPFSGEVNAWITREAAQIRAAIAAELGVSPKTIALTENVSVGCNIALWGIDWHPEDHILLSDCEHPSVVATVQEIQRRFGVNVSTCPLMATLNQGDPVATIAQHLQPQTRLVVLSHILWNTGQVLPLGEIVETCHTYAAAQQPVQVLVDAAQSVGVLPLNLTELAVDFYAFTGHKWWCGPAGLGGLYIRPETLASLSPTFIGWRGITKNAAGDPTGWQPGGERFEVATSDYPLLAGLQAAIALHETWGSTATRYQQIQVLSQYLWQRLVELPQINCLRTQPPEAGLVSFCLTSYDQKPYGQLHEQLVQFLESQGILTRTIRHPDCVRVCIHYFTSQAELDRLVAAIEQFCQNRNL